MRKWFEQYFVFTRWERNAIIALLLLSGLVLLVPKIYLHLKPATKEDNSKTKNEVAEFLKQYNEEEGDSTTNSEPIKEEPAAGSISYFYFDPNKIGKGEWIKLGLTEKQAESIEKFKAKNGTFKKAEDLKKLYVLKEEDYKRLAPYVKIETSDAKEELASEKTIVDINKAEAADFENLNGVGHVLAKRIVKYRTKLGGFDSIPQLKKVYGLSSETYEHIKGRLTLGKKQKGKTEK